MLNIIEKFLNCLDNKITNIGMSFSIIFVFITFIFSYKDAITILNILSKIILELL